MEAQMLPTECIQLILRQVKDTSTLHSLLLVNRTWFPVVAQCLYRDPFSRIEYCKNGLQALDLLLTLLLSLTPAKDPIVLALQNDLGATTKFSTSSYSSFRAFPRRTVFDKCSVDYLAFIRVIQFSHSVTNWLANLKQRSFAPLKYDTASTLPWPFRTREAQKSVGPPSQDSLPVSDQLLLSGFLPEARSNVRLEAVQHAITLAITSDRYHQMNELQIPLRYLPVYQQHVEALTNLQSIIFDYGRFGVSAHPALGMVRHSVEFLRNFVAIHDRASRGNLEVRYVGPTSNAEYLLAPVFQEALRVLGPHYVPSHLTDYNFTSDFQHWNHVESIQLTHSCRLDTIKTTISMLERCHSLRELQMTYDSHRNRLQAETVDQSCMFEWAAGRYRDYFEGPSSLFLGSPLRQTLPPLCKVNLTYFGCHTDRIVDDLLYAFGETLVDVCLNLEPWRGSVAVMGSRLGPWRCPKLRYFRIRTEYPLELAPDAFGEFPQLERLQLEDYTGVAKSLPAKIFQPWCLPNLTHLFLAGLAAACFNVQSIQSMPKLACLAIQNSFFPADTHSDICQWSSLASHLSEAVFVPMFLEEYAYFGGKGPLYTFGPEAGSLMALKIIRLRGKVANDFPIASLFLCHLLPNLEELSLDIAPFERELISTTIFSATGMATTVTTSGTDTPGWGTSLVTSYSLYSTHSRLRHLSLRGPWTIRREALLELLALFPCISTIKFAKSVVGISPTDLVMAIQQMPSPPKTVEHGDDLVPKVAKVCCLEKVDLRQSKNNSQTTFKFGVWNYRPLSVMTQCTASFAASATRLGENVAAAAGQVTRSKERTTNI